MEATNESKGLPIPKAAATEREGSQPTMAAAFAESLGSVAQRNVVKGIQNTPRLLQQREQIASIHMSPMVMQQKNLVDVAHNSKISEGKNAQERSSSTKVLQAFFDHSAYPEAATAFTTAANKAEEFDETLEQINTKDPNAMDIGNPVLEELQKNLNTKSSNIRTATGVAYEALHWDKMDENIVIGPGQTQGQNDLKKYQINKNPSIKNPSKFGEVKSAHGIASAIAVIQTAISGGAKNIELYVSDVNGDNEFTERNAFKVTKPARMVRIFKENKLLLTLVATLQVHAKNNPKGTSKFNIYQTQ